MANYYELKLGRMQVIPTFSLASSRGSRIGLWDYKQRKNLVIFYFRDEECTGCLDRLRDLARDYPRFRDLDSEVLAVTTADQGEVARLARELELPFPVLADPDARFIEGLVSYDRAAGPPPVGLFVTDRFGALYTQKVGSTTSDLPPVDDTLDTIYYIEMQCPECGAPEWPSAEA